MPCTLTITINFIGIKMLPFCCTYLGIYKITNVKRIGITSFWTTLADVNTIFSRFFLEPEQWWYIWPRISIWYVCVVTIYIRNRVHNWTSYGLTVWKIIISFILCWDDEPLSLREVSTTIIAQKLIHGIYLLSTNYANNYCNYFPSPKLGNFSLENKSDPPSATFPQNFIAPIDRAPFETYVYKVILLHQSIEHLLKRMYTKF